MKTAEQACLAKCLQLLSKMAYSKRRLREKLGAVYDAETIERVIACLEAQHYLDEPRDCLLWLEHYRRQSNKSNYEISALLSQRGYERALIRACLDRLDPEEELQTAIVVLQGLIRQKSSVDSQEKQKIMQKLLRHGFPMDIVLKAMQIVCQPELDFDENF
ncbi:MAG: recombination regulator RecX [Negativicutes bacterium]|nr:recombination regulator RecX [Negativicutes bacterium]